MTKSGWFVSALVVLVMGVAAQAAAKDYVLQAGKWGAAQTRAVNAAGGVVVFSHAKTGLGVATSDSPDFASRLAASGAFSGVAEDMLVRWTPESRSITLDETPIDPANDTLYRIQWAPSAVHAPEAWAAGCTGKGVRVAILDGGLFSAHPDLAANIDAARSASFVPGQAWNTDTGTFWHGTHVAGIVGAVDNSTGVVGIAPEATLIGVKVLHNGSGSFGWIIAGILYAATPIAEGGAGADIINMSLGAVFERAGGAGPLVGALAKAVNYAGSNGVLVVSAAGNDALDLDHSASYISVPAMSGSGIAASATGPMGWALGETNYTRIASYTNYGHSIVNVAGPGGDFAYPGEESCTFAGVTAPCWVFDMVLSTSRAGYSWAAGTSMAAPAVAAVAALVKGSHPGISLGALKAAIANSADDAGKKGNDPYYGKGFVNAYKACTY